MSDRPKALSIRRLMVVIALASVVLGGVAMYQRGVLVKREVKLRVLCVANLQQISLAIANYESAYGAFPAGSIPNPDLPSDRRVGWMFSIQPYLGDHPFDRPELARLAWDDPTLRPILMKLPALNTNYCPAAFAEAPAGSLIPANYVGIAGVGLDASTLPKNHPRAGFFGDDRVLFPSDIKDGFSTTMTIVESSRPAGPWYAGGRNSARAIDPARRPYLGPNRPFGGLHRESTAVVMVDGSVRFLRDTIDPRVFEGLATIAGGEIVSVP